MLVFVRPASRNSSAKEASRNARNSCLIAVFLIGSSAQEQLGVSFTVEGLEAFWRWVEELGWWGPGVFVLLVILRLFIGLSSHLILIFGGLAFGFTGGIV